MFTGIVQAMGEVRSLDRVAGGARLVLDAPALARPLTLGASIAVSGVCLTVVASDPAQVEFDVVPETLARTTLGELALGARVNLEPSLRAGDAMDGHVVQGHVDGVARVMRVDRGGGAHVATFRLHPELMMFVIPKGSIAIDGVSLTIADIPAKDMFSVALIPTTLDVTTLGALKPQDPVNIETDILARTVVSTLLRWNRREGEPPQQITRAMLREQGFV
jgi:riboflavin synthase